MDPISLVYQTFHDAQCTNLTYDIIVTVIVLSVVFFFLGWAYIVMWKEKFRKEHS